MSSYFERSESLRKSLEAVAFSFVYRHESLTLSLDDGF